MPLTAVRHIRKMRGGAQSHLLEADDGRWYVVKFRNNPQHRRILINEMLSAVFLDYLKISAPVIAFSIPFSELGSNGWTVSIRGSGTLIVASWFNGVGVP